MSGTYTLQILHASDFEGGVEAVQRAPNFAAIVDRLEDTYANSITVSSGDNFIPGPFTAAGTDNSVRDEIASYYEQSLGLAAGSLTGIRNGTTPFNAADIAILNAIGIQASTIGNHEFDLGPNAFAGSFDFTATLPALPAQPTLASITGIGAQFPYLSSNLTFTNESSLSGLFTSTVQDVGAYVTTAAELSTGAGIRAEATGRELAPATTITRGGQTIGILAVTTQVLASISSVGNVTVNDPNGDGGRDNMDELAAILQPQINAMLGQGINKIILMSHLQNLNNERALATRLSGVDVIIGGGSNTLLADSTDPLAPGQVAAGNYPEFYTTANGGRVALVNTDGNYNYVGRLVIDFDAAGNIIESSVNPAISGAYVTTDAGVDRVVGNNDGTLSTAERATIFADGTRGGEVKQIADAVGEVINQKDGQIWGYSNVYLEGDRVFGRSQEVNLGSLSADANLSVAQNALGTVFVGSLKNGGGIRAAIGDIDDATGAKLGTAANPTAGKPANAISTLDIENALRFDNKLVVFDTTPAGLRAILEHGVGLAPGNGGYPQIGGIKLAYDPSLAAGSRITSLALTDLNGNITARIVENGQLVAGAPATISMTSLSFTANGGDGYPIKANASNFRYILFDGSLSAAVDPSLDLTAAATAATVGQTLATILGEQRAFQIFLQQKHGTVATAYNTPDTAASLDQRIENLNLRGDAVFQSAPINGDATSQAISGGVGDDAIFGGGGNDTLAGAVGQDSLDGGSGSDQLFGGAGNDSLTGGAGDDQLHGGAGRDIAAGGAGNDGYTIEDVSDVILEDVGAGTDSAFVFVNDWTAAANVEVIYLYGTATRLNGGAASDTLVANATLGSIIDGGAGNDTIYGQAGNDSLTGGADADMLFAGGGNDTLTGGTGNDTLVGGAGDDTYVVDDAGDVVGENAGEGTDIVFVSASNWAGGDNIETVRVIGTANVIYATNGNAVFVANPNLGTALIGGIGNDQFFGNGFNDSLTGGAGNDVLRGEGGNDLLIGGAGNDQLVGGAGADIFVFGTGWGYDQVFDFSRAEGDRFDMRGTGATFPNLAIRTIGPDTLVEFGSSRFDVYGVTGLQASDFIFG